MSDGMLMSWPPSPEPSIEKMRQFADAGEADRAAARARLIDPKASKNERFAAALQLGASLYVSPDVARALELDAGQRSCGPRIVVRSALPPGSAYAVMEPAFEVPWLRLSEEWRRG